MADDGSRPHLPPRSSALDVLQKASDITEQLPRPKLVSAPTTALSSAIIQSRSVAHAESESYRTGRGTSKGPLFTSTFTPKAEKNRIGPRVEREFNDAESVMSAAASSSRFDVESLLGEVLATERQSPLWRGQTQASERPEFESLNDDADDIFQDISSEFTEVESQSNGEISDEQLLSQWRSKRKHFLILSQSGKPIWQRHGTDRLISGYIGAIQTIISFFESADDNLRTFTAGDTRFVVLSQGPLYLVAVSKLGESEHQLRSQLDALYMQILSTLTHPHLTRMFSLRPSMDLRRPLRGTENLLSALADNFTRGSASTLLSSLECLRLPNRHRQAINAILLRKRCSELLYGLVVAGGRLVNVVRPKTHSLHPNDLQLIFNMLFEAEGIQSGGGESWIPICLPGFNRDGYLYMYVSYLEDETDRSQAPRYEEPANTNDGSVRTRSIKVTNPIRQQIAIILISSKKEAFFELQGCRDSIVSSLESSSLLRVVRNAVNDGRPKIDDIVPGSGMRHFLYKSRGNLQFLMPSWHDDANKVVEQRRLMAIYEGLHASMHARGSQLKVQHSISRSASSIAWLTDVFELYCIADPGTSKTVLAKAANKIVGWIKKEQERVFIIGGAVF